MEIRMTQLLIRGGRVLDLEGDLDNPPVRDVLIEGNTIAAVAPQLEPEATIIDARGMLVVPGFVNAHYHSHDVLARGMFEDLALEHWGTLAGPLAQRRPLPEVRARTLLGALECLRNGITAVQDMSSFSPMSDEYIDAILDAYAEAGIRVIFSVTLRDLSQLDTIAWIKELAPRELHDFIGRQSDPAGPQMEFIARQLERIGSRDGMVHWALSPSAPQRCSPPLLESVADLARRRRLPVYTHVYETRTQRIFAQRHLSAYGGSAVRLMQAAGLLGPHVTIAHGVWAQEDELDLIGASGTNVVLNMLSNLKLKSGVAPVLGYRARGVNLALGCDNCSCSDAQSMLQVMKLFCLMSAVSSPRRTGANAAEALRAATLGGARTAGLEKELGALRPGYKADLVLMDLGDPAYVPLNSAVRQLVYSDSGRSVRTVIVDGRVVVRDGRATRVDEAALRTEVEGLMPQVRADVGRLRAGYESVRPFLDQVQERAWATPLPIDRMVGGRPAR
jgi:cytosine/adenosine deaminase-related metal-dependent hydrolase